MQNAKVVTIDSYRYVKPYNEEALRRAVAKQPVSALMDARGYDFLYYTGVSFESDFNFCLDH